MNSAKYIRELVLSDFHDHPVWEYLKTDEIEQGLLVRPLKEYPVQLKKRLSSAAIFETFFVRVEYIAANKRRYEGFCKITNHTAKFMLQAFEPVIIHEFRQIPVWYGMHIPDKQDLEDIYMHLRIDPGNLFPLHMKIVPDVHHVDDSGMINGFYGLDDSMQMKKLDLNII